MTIAIRPERRRQLALQTGKSDAYLYQCLAGLRDMNPAEARRLEEVTAGELNRRMLCQKSWAAIWPELVQPDSPPSPGTTQEASHAA